MTARAYEGEGRIVAQRIARRGVSEANRLRAWAAALFANSDGEAKASTRRGKRGRVARSHTRMVKAKAAAYFDRCTAAGIVAGLTPWRVDAP